MNKFFVLFNIILILSVSRFVPHPPNFTSLIALSFYIPAIFGKRYIAMVILSFAITDLIIGFHQTIFFTWGSVLIIGLISKYFSNSISKRLFGVLVGAFIFFLITNFGFWSLGIYGYSINSFIYNYFLALPFFGYSLISTIIFSCLIEFMLLIIQRKYSFRIK